MTNVFQVLEQDVVIVWDDFQKGLKWVDKEAAIIANWVKTADPAVAASVQNIITKGEEAAATLAQYGGDALSGVIAASVDGIETEVANFVSASLGGAPGAALTKAGQSIVGDTGTILSSVVHVALTKVLSGLASSALAAAAKPAAPAIPAVVVAPPPGQ